MKFFKVMLLITGLLLALNGCASLPEGITETRAAYTGFDQYKKAAIWVTDPEDTLASSTPELKRYIAQHLRSQLEFDAVFPQVVIMNKKDKKYDLIIKASVVEINATRDNYMYFYGMIPVGTSSVMSGQIYLQVQFIEPKSRTVLGEIKVERQGNCEVKYFTEVYECMINAAVDSIVSYITQNLEAKADEQL